MQQNQHPRGGLPRTFQYFVAFFAGTNVHGNNATEN